MTDWLGEFEQLVLFAVVSLEPDGYGTTIRQLIEEKADRQVSAGALYTTLERLEARGLVMSSWGEPTAERGGKRKRHYRLRPAGRAALTRSWQALRALARSATPRLEQP